MALFGGKKSKKKWTEIDHMGSACTQFAMYTRNNATIRKDDPVRLELGSIFFSIANWLDNSYKSEYFTTMFKVGYPDQSFEVKWKPDVVTKVRNEQLGELEKLTNSFTEYLRTSDGLVIPTALINCMGKNPQEKDSLDSIEENLLYCINGIVSDGIDAFKGRRNLEDEPFMSACLAGGLGGISILLYRFAK
jgi:hypothetical protein